MNISIYLNKFVAFFLKEPKTDKERKQTFNKIIGVYLFKNFFVKHFASKHVLNFADIWYHDEKQLIYMKV